VQVIVWHEKGYESGVPLVTSLERAEEGIHWYSRIRIKEFRGVVEQQGAGAVDADEL